MFDQAFFDKKTAKPLAFAFNGSIYNPGPFRSQKDLP